jgi:GntR family transcriptional regulator, histidine utilization repressor
MTSAAPVTWQAIRDEALRRIRERDWTPGERIPDEAVLASELGCARATVNRALRQLAAEGFLERRRKGGTRVPLTPVRKATFEIPIIRLDVEGRGQVHGYRLLAREETTPPDEVAAALRLGAGQRFLHLRALHTADGAPFCFEDRWLNPATPGAERADFETVSANEWLVREVAFSGGGIAFLALPADEGLAGLLGCAVGEALFAVERTTRAGALPITFVRLPYAPGYRMDTSI